MRFSSFALLPFVAVIGCASTGSTERVCTSHVGRTCSGWEVRETAQGKFLRESQDRWAAERASREGTAFFPAQAPGESSFHYLSRVNDANGKSGSSSAWGSYSTSGAPSGGTTSGGSGFGSFSPFGSSSFGSGSSGGGFSFGGGKGH
jgi:hypothetical protein